MHHAKHRDLIRELIDQCTTCRLIQECQKIEGVPLDEEQFLAIVVNHYRHHRTPGSRPSIYLH